MKRLILVVSTVIAFMFPNVSHGQDVILPWLYVLGDFTVKGAINTNSIDEGTSGSGIGLGNNTLYIDQANQRVGIGTTSPGSQFVIENSYGNSIYFDDIGTTLIMKSNKDLMLSSATSSIQPFGSFFPGVDNGYSLGQIARRWNSFYTINITDDGSNVGIGTTNPGAKLEVAGDLNSNEFISIGDTSGNPQVLSFNRNSLTGDIYNSAKYAWTIVANNSNNLRFSRYNGSGVLQSDDLLLKDNGDVGISNNGLYVESTGNVGIGTTTPDSATLQIAAGVGAHELWLGDATTYSYIDAGDAGWTSSSTREVKENIVDVSGIDLSKFRLVKPKRYNFKKLARSFKSEYIAGWDTLSMADRGKEEMKWLQRENARAAKLAAKKRVGFIAEDIGLLEGNPNKRQINNSEIIAILWLKVQELEKRIKVLEAKP